MLGGGAIGLLAALIFAAAGAAILKRRPVPPPAKRLFVAGLFLRVAGALAYLYVIGAMYGGGDYFMYYDLGIGYAKALWSGDYDYFLNIFELSRWWGTAFTIWLTGWVLAFFGPTLPGAFIVFALAGFVGVLSLGYSFARAFPAADWRRYFAFIMFFPSLWFWPAALGKDAVVLCGIGVATLGFVGRRNHIRWQLMAFGVFLVFVIRPQVAATLVFAVIAGQWLGTLKKWSAKSTLQAVFLLGVGTAVISMSGGALGVDLFNTEEVELYLMSRGSVSSIGGSAIQSADTAAPWLAPINTLFRPFPWEARGITAMLAAIEVIVLWGMAWYRRRAIAGFVRAYKKSRVFWMAVAFVLVYATALGMSLGNIGIIARQRVHILPFIFMFIAGLPKVPKRSGKLRGRLLRGHFRPFSRPRTPGVKPGEPKENPVSVRSNRRNSGDAQLSIRWRR